MPKLPQMFPRQLEVANIIARAKRGTRTLIGYGGSMSGGKGLALDTPMFTTEGWKTMGDLRVGDYVFAPDGNPTRVSYVSETKHRPCYRVTLNDGATIICDDEHKWQVWTHALRIKASHHSDEWRARRRESRPSRAGNNRTTTQSAAISERNSRDIRLGPKPESVTVDANQLYEMVRDTPMGKRISIERALGLQLPEKELILEPYLLGLWLGDGSSSSGAMACGDEDRGFMEAQWRERGYQPTKRSDPVVFGLPGLSFTLKQVGVLNNKHIPRHYLMASYDQRLDLLKGLMDTDGTVCKPGGQVEFTTTNPRLANDFEELVRSLGWGVNKREGRAKLNGRDCGPVWDIKWTPDKVVFRLERKAKYQKMGGPRTRHRAIASMEKVESVPTRCIMVESESHCFLAGRELILTHNTSLIAMLAVQYALQFPGANIVIARHDIVSLRPTTMARFYEYCPTQLEDGTQILFSRDDNNKNLCKLRLPHWPPGVYSTVYFRGLADPKFFFSIELTALFIDECGQIPEYNVLIALTRLRQQLPDGTLPKWLFLAATNPGASWFDDWFLDPDAGKMAKLREAMGEDGLGIGAIEFVFSGPKDNPHTDSNYGRFLNAVLPDELREMYVEGEFGSYEGKVFTNFIPSNLALSQKDILRGWGVDGCVSVDLGDRKLYIPKFVYAVGGLDFAGEQRNAHASTAGVRIILPPHRKDGTSRDIAIDDWSGKGPGVFIRQREYMKKMEKALHRKIDWVADKTQPAGIQALREHGFKVHENEGGNDSWLNGVGIIKSRFELDEKGFPLSLYLDHLKEWEKEMTRYHLDPRPNANGEMKEKPVRVGDDRVDWYRYSTEYLDKLVKFERPRPNLPYAHDTRPKPDGLTLGDFAALSKMLTSKAG